MGSSFPERDPAYFGFTDLHGFKDFIVEVIAGSPDNYMEMDWLASEDQMNLDRAFEGLRYGLDLIENAKCTPSDVVARCKLIVDDAYLDYKAGREKVGRHKLEDAERLVSKLPST